MHPKVSVFVFVHQSGSCLLNCLDSLSAQVCGGLEVFVVDYCLSGSVRSIVAQYGSRFRHVRQEEGRPFLREEIKDRLGLRGDFVLDLQPEDWRASAPERIRLVLQQNRTSVWNVLRLMREHGCSDVDLERVADLQWVICKGVLEENQWKGDQQFGEIVELLNEIYGADFVMPRAIGWRDDFLVRYRPQFLDVRNAGGARPRRIGIVCLHAQGGGAERATLLLAKELKSSGYDVIWFNDDVFEKEIAANGLLREIRFRSLPSGDAGRRWRALTQAIKSGRVDTVMLPDHWRKCFIPDVLCAKLAGAKVVVAEHNAYFYPLDDVQPDLYCKRENFYRFADAITVLSPAMVAWWKTAGLDNVVFMPNMLTFEVDKAGGPREAQDRPSFLCVGRICRRKNMGAVLEAFRLYKDHGGTGRLVFLGRYEDAQTGQAFEDMIRRLALQDSVDVRGEVGDVAHFYQSSDILLMASRLEGAPMVIAEAKSYGIPTIMFELPYVDAARMDDGVVAVPQGDVVAMARQMRLCTTDRDLYRELSRRAYGSLAPYERSKIMKRWEELFDAMECQRPIPSLCEEVPAKEMLKMTMQSLSLLSRRWQRFCESHGYSVGYDDTPCDTTEELRREVESLKRSAAYRVGMAVSWPLRKIRQKLMHRT